MRKFLPLLLLCLLAVSGFLPARASASRAASLEKIDAYVREHMQHSSIPGLSYAIIQEGKIVHLNALGVANPTGRPMTPQTPLYIGSVGKTFTALAIRQLANAGKLDLNTPVVATLPYFTLAGGEPAREITIRQLIDHTSGFGNQDGNDPVFYRPGASNEELVRLLNTFHLNRPVGQSFEYSNINYIILGQVIEAVSGIPYPDYIQQFVFSPLEMKHSFADEAGARMDGLSAGYRYYFGLSRAVELDEPQGAIAAGFLISSAEDMAHYLIAFTEHGSYNGKSVVAPSGVPSPEDSRLTYNIDWLSQNEAKRPTNTETHSGAWLNYSAGIAFMPAEKIGVVVLANSNPAQWLPAKDAFALTIDILRLYTGNPPGPATIPVARQYIVVDALLLGIAGFVAFRFATLRGWRTRLNSFGRSPRTWLPSMLVDLLLPGFILLAGPGILLASTGKLDPVWGWNRLAFQVPDLTWAIFLLACALLSVGIGKFGILVGMRMGNDQHRIQASPEY